MVDTERRSGLQGVAAAGELKNDGAPPLDGGHGMLMEHGEQVTQPVRGREGLKQAGLAWHRSSLNAWQYHGKKAFREGRRRGRQQANRAVGSSNLLMNQAA